MSRNSVQLVFVETVAVCKLLFILISNPKGKHFLRQLTIVLQNVCDIYLVNSTDIQYNLKKEQEISPKKGNGVHFYHKTIFKEVCI